MEKKTENTEVIQEDKKTYKLRKPFEFEGKTYTEFTFNFDSLTGNDFLNIEAEIESTMLVSTAGMLSKTALGAEYSKPIQLGIAARAAGIPRELIQALPLRDFNAIINIAKNFILELED